MPRLLAFALALIPIILAAVSPRAQKLHNEAFVFDAHVHVINRQFYHGGDIGQRVADGRSTYPVRRTAASMRCSFLSSSPKTITRSAWK